MNDSEKTDTAKKSLVELIDYADRLISSSHIIGRRNYDDWIWKCNIEVQKIFGSNSSQFQSIRALQDINNSFLLGNIDQAGRDSMISEIANKRSVLQNIVGTIQVEKIDHGYLSPETAYSGPKWAPILELIGHRF